MHLQDIDTSGMMFDPKANNFLSTFRNMVPNAKSRKIDSLGELNCYKYVALMYDPNSPLVKDVNDYWQRKVEAVDASGFKIAADGSLDAKVEDLLLGKNQEVIDLIVDFLAYIKYPTWTTLIFMHERLLKSTNDVLGFGVSETARVDDVYKIGARIQELTTTFLGETLKNETTDFKRRFSLKVEEQRLGIRPEDFTDRLNKGDNLKDGSPYGDYVPAKIKFRNQ